MKWATRRHCHIDRAACAWLIRRFLDTDAEFVFVDDPDEVPADATPLPLVRREHATFFAVLTTGGSLPGNARQRSAAFSDFGEPRWTS